MVKISELIGAGLHIGRTRRDWVPVSEKYLAGYRYSVAIFDMAQTSFYMSRAVKFVELAVSHHARGFFYGLGRGDRKRIYTLAKFDQIVARTRWNGGFLTNMRKFKKKIRNFNKVPTFMVCFKFETRNYSALREKHRLKLPLICPIDSNSDPAYVEYPVPSNAPGRGTAGYFGHCFSRAVFSGIMKRIKNFSYKAAQIRKAKQARIMLNRGRPKGRNRYTRHENYNKKKYVNYGRKRNRTAAVSFSGLYSTIELSP